MDILDILLDILLKPPQPLMGLFFMPPLSWVIGDIIGVSLIFFLLYCCVCRHACKRLFVILLYFELQTVLQKVSLDLVSRELQTVLQTVSLLVFCVFRSLYYCPRDVHFPTLHQHYLCYFQHPMIIVFFFLVDLRFLFH